MDLTRIEHRLDRRSRILRIVVETPRGGRWKYTYAADIGAFEVGHLLPQGLTFPLDFGFIPCTEGEDGDPLDIMVVADEPLATGAVLDVRLVGVLKAEQTEEGETVRNDRLIGIACESRIFASVRKLSDLGDSFIPDLERFWVAHNQARGARFKVVEVADGKAAAELVVQYGSA